MLKNKKTKDNNINISKQKTQKHKLAINFFKILSVIFALLAVMLIITVLCKAIFDPGTFITNVNGIIQKSWSWVCLSIVIIASLFGIPSFVSYLFYKKLKK